MLERNSPLVNKHDELLIELAAAAHLMSSQPGTRGAFIDVELDLWHAVQAKVRQTLQTGLNDTASRN
jgi:hypothetical protein